MIDNSLVKVDRERIKAALDTYKRIKSEQEAIYYKAVDKYVLENQGIVGSLWWKRSLTDKEIIFKDVDYFFGIYSTVHDKLISKNYLTKKDVGVYFSGFLQGRADSIEAMLACGSEIYLTPELSSFVSRFTRQAKELKEQGE